MNTACSQFPSSSTTPLTTCQVASTWAGIARAWWAHWMASRQAPRTESELTALDGLRAETLKDIGAPEWVYERALRTEERARQGGLFERDAMHWR